jgi:hypothetical protein
LPIAAINDHRNCVAILPSIALSPPSPTTIALPSCLLASSLDATPPLNVPNGCNMGLVVVTSPLIMPLPLNVQAGSHVAS